ncbi:MAG: c-type cytochrome [Planctomycetes bacterium]|nr:c-type cytochrome [Planctomycetota bacterium]
MKISFVGKHQQPRASVRFCARADAKPGASALRLIEVVVFRQTLVFVATILLMTLGCNQNYNSILYQPNKKNRPKPPSEVADFHRLFANNCSGCHGDGGLQGAAPPIGNKLFLAMISEKQLSDIISNGRPGTLMPPFVTTNGEGLTPQQVEIVADGMKRGQLHNSLDDRRNQVIPPYHSGPGSSDPADVAVGAKLFGVFCAHCHGDEGKGAEAGPLNDSALLSLLSDQAIRTLIFTGRADLKTRGKEAMPSYFALTEVTPENAEAKWREVDQIVAYIASWRKAVPSVPLPAKKGVDR